MALIATSAERAQNNIIKAEATVTEWQAKAAAARAEANDLDANAGAAILEDESAAERVTLQVQSLERKARAYDQAATEAAGRLKTARLAALETAAEDETARADKARKQADAHEAKVNAMLAKLEEFDDAEWERRSYREGTATVSHVGKAGALRDEAFRGDVRTAVIRYFIANGKTPDSFWEINQQLGTDFPSMGQPLYEYAGMVPDCVTEALADGRTFN
ncbi:hypothetical protein [Paeniglutamicibacter antarcticus]|uniref:Uncharacterized protein n=1 Tax=Paeniglutamicibacter antarcticus TaxID=494023 RepID=A0ABP9TN13_9MICC